MEKSISPIIGPIVTLISALIGSIITLLAVYLTLRHNRRVHEENLIEERKKRKEEREFRAKQESLILAVDSFTRFLAFFISIPDRQLPQNGSIAPEITELCVALNKLHFYCSLKTIEKATYLGKILDEVISVVIKAKMPSVFIIEEIKILDSRISYLEKLIAVLQEEVRSILYSEPKSPLLASHRNQLAQFFQQISMLNERKVDLVKNKYRETEKCRDVVAKNLKAIHQASRDVLLLAREELEFPIDAISYKEIMDNQTESMIKNLEELYSYLRSEIEKKMK